MMLYILLIVVQGVIWAPITIWAENCDHLGVVLYEDLGCTPHRKDETTCPTKYTCEFENKDKGCIFRGTKYLFGAKLNNTEISRNCYVDCRCSQQSSSFDCAPINCPEYMRNRPSPGCYFKYDLGTCCSTGQICPPFDDSIKCVVDGKEFKEGERFSLPDTCSKCVCQKGFQGKLEAPFCERQTCGAQLLQLSRNARDKCAPIFFASDKGLKCCPTSWICGGGLEEIRGVAKSEDTCVFGNRTLRVGQSIKMSNVDDEYGRRFEEVECECGLPPLLTCRWVGH